MRLSGISRVMANAAVVSCCILSACSGKYKASEADLNEARHLGAERARELSPAVIKSDTLTVEQILIDVREREQRLRHAGYDDMADSYLSGFISALDSINPSLASELH